MLLRQVDPHPAQHALMQPQGFGAVLLIGCRLHGIKPAQHLRRDHHRSGHARLGDRAMSESSGTRWTLSRSRSRPQDRHQPGQKQQSHCPVASGWAHQDGQPWALRPELLAEAPDSVSAQQPLPLRHPLNPILNLLIKLLQLLDVLV